MDYEKLVVALLIITVLLSVTSVILLVSADVGDGQKINPENLVDVNSGNVQFSIGQTPQNSGVGT